MAGLTLDAGALIDAERAGRMTALIVGEAIARGESITVPAGVLAQVWRSDRNARLALFLRNCLVEPLTETQAKGVGRLLARSGTSDIVDASLVLSAASRGDVIVTSDAADIQHLTALVTGVAGILLM